LASILAPFWKPFGIHVHVFSRSIFKWFFGWYFSWKWLPKWPQTSKMQTPFFLTFSILLIYIDLCWSMLIYVDVGSLLAHFWLTFGSLWLSLGSLLVTFDLLFLILGIHFLTFVSFFISLP
jgi:hypothetical protein